MGQLNLIAPQAIGGLAPIIPIYPGSKRSPMYREAIYGGRFVWDTVLEPFTGGGAASLYARADRRFLADVAPDVLSIWRSWIHGHWGKVREAIADYQAIAQADPQAAWDKAKARYELGGSGPKLATASLVLRKLAFGGVIRTGASGKLNISMGDGKIAPFLNWKSSPPDPGPGWDIQESWEAAIANWQRSNTGQTLAVVDPPYFLPYGPGTARRGTGLMTPAYADHKPHAVETLELCIEPTAAIAANANATRIVVCNYYSPDLDEALRAIADSNNRPLEHFAFGRMNRMNNGNGQPKVLADEWLWVMGGIS